MMKILGQIVFCSLISQISGVFWDDLRVTWGPAPTEGFFTKLPRVVTEAVSQGWTTNINQNCENSGNFSGFRYKLPNENAINLLFDKNGVIAGVQALLPHDEIMNPNNTFRYDLVPMYKNETINGKEFVVLTAYFIPPETICTIGRTPFDLLQQGTGTGLFFQNGETPNAQIDVPMTRPEAAEQGWTNCECFPSMGLHNFYKVEEWAPTNCNQIQPTQATFNLDGEMLGFVLQAPGPTSSPRFETPPNAALVAIIGASRVPQCILDANTRFGLSTIHFYFVSEPWNIGCTK